MQIIPAIDIIDGKCVRLTQGDYAQKTVYHDYPAEVAKSFEDAGITRLHLVDLDGAKTGTPVNLQTLEEIANATKLHIDFGGGVKTDQHLDELFSAGAAMAAIGSVAVKDPSLFFSWLKKYGSEKIFLGADVKNKMLAVSGWMETTDILVTDFLRINSIKGVKHVFCTDVSKDGMLQGPSTSLYKEIMQQIPSIELVASGGVSSLQDLLELKQAGLAGAIVGKAFYEGKITLKELASFN